MYTIRPIEPAESMTAKRLIYTVAREIFGDTRPLEEMICELEASHELGDMDDIQQNYFEQGGVFLVLLDDKTIIGTGAIRRLEDGICEIKRLWLASTYHGHGLGYQMIQSLFGIARSRGYHSARLQTDPRYQARALAFYRRLGFYDIPMYCESEGDISLEIKL